MSPAGKTPSPTTRVFTDDDDDFTALDALAPTEDAGDFANVSATRVASADEVSRTSAIARDQARAAALNISMATTLIEPLPPGQVAFLELLGGSPVILEKSVTVLGRVAGVNDLALDDDSISRQHAAIVYAQGEFFLEDLGSSNGTKVEGARITVVPLKPGMSFQVGRQTFTFRVRVP